jgi:flagellar basal-body rod modification protein FlgD
MSAISGIDTGLSQSLNQVEGKGGAMGKNDFLLLLVAQLENQDPMNPQDATEFTAQLAQFSSLEQLENVNKSLEGLGAMSSEMERMSALGLIGQNVVAQTGNFHFSGDPVQLGYRLNTQADDVKMYVLNQTGSTVATISSQQTDPGQYFINWDGLGDSGMPLEAGNYSLAIRAVGKDDNLLQVDSLIKGKVNVVDMSEATPKLETNAGTFALNKVEKAGGSL